MKWSSGDGVVVVLIGKPGAVKFIDLAPIHQDQRAGEGYISAASIREDAFDPFSVGNRQPCGRLRVGSKR